MTPLAIFAAVIFWCGCGGMLFGVLLALTAPLTHEGYERAATRKGRGGDAVPSSGPTNKQSHIAHDRADR